MSENDAVTWTTTWDQAIGAVLSLSLIIAWCDPGQEPVDGVMQARYLREARRLISSVTSSGAWRAQALRR
ncbi:MAG TPA: hypothetical protein DCQ36_09515 [Actinobacteria bacterium]|nr:hypothetical protein [Actinomycetota bacterium]